ncbi:hypothetical protein HanPI659440_Chr13g0500231 [Helianthus annuus]|nr:hypothetical protein HanPI659440_Chr13g0500231 [Helianthus annuus]
MSELYQIQCSIDIPDDEIADWIIDDSDANANATTKKPPKPKIPRVPEQVISEKQKYYVPRAVSIGPYYFNKDPKLQVVQKLKTVFTMKLLNHNKETLKILYKKLGESHMVQELRDYYEQGSTTEYSNKDFTKMMLLDSCFILHFIHSLWEDAGLEELYDENPNLFWFVYHDLMLLQNQIPFKVLKQVMSLGNICGLDQICKFIVTIEWLDLDMIDQSDAVRSAVQSAVQDLRSRIMDENEPHHLLHLLHGTRAPQARDGRKTDYSTKSSTFPNVNQLLDVGVRFKPAADDNISLDKVEFSNGCCMFSATVQLPSITLAPDDSSKLFWLNLIAYERWSVKNDAWVISYVCLLQSMISNHEDVKVLKNAGVLESFLGNDHDVVVLFNDITTDLVPRNKTYIDVMDAIQRHSDYWNESAFSEFSKEYRKSPWKFISLVGAFIALFLTSVQTYFTVWSLE